jgi:molybdopterin-guanine dinucleotide biosynthesis protein A
MASRETDGTATARTPDHPRGVVLAGGRSQRFGAANKALASMDGESLLGRAVAAVRSGGTGPPIVAVQSERQQARFERVLDSPVEFVGDDPALAGPLAGVVSAARTTSTDRIAVVGCDMPFVNGEAIRWLARRSSASDAIVPVDGAGALQPLHAVYQTGVFSAKAVRSGSLRAVLDGLDCCRVPVGTAPSTLPLGRSLTNVNTKSELRDARQRTDRTE